MSLFHIFCYCSFSCIRWVVKSSSYPSKASLVAQMVKYTPAMQETWVQPLSWKDSLEKRMATHSSALAWRIPWTEEPSGLSPWGCTELDKTERLHFHFHYLLLEKEMATHSSALAWRIPRTEEPSGLSPWSCTELEMTERLLLPPLFTFRFTVLFSLVSKVEFSWNDFPLFSIFFALNKCSKDTFPWRRKWQPTPVLLPGESRGQRSLAG